MELHEINLLNEMIKHDKLDSNVLVQLNTMKKEKVHQVHSYKITAPYNKSARWQTYIIDEKNKRKKISSITEKGLYEKLYIHYYDSSNITLASIYPSWVEKRQTENLSPRTMRRYENFWNKYYINHAIVTMPLTKVTSDIIEAFFHSVISKHNITVKELNNMKFIMKNIMKMAKRRKLISNNPFHDVEIKTYACKPPKKHADTSRIYLPHEKEALFRALNQDLSDNPSVTDSYGIFLLFKLGLRIGELVAIRDCDINYDSKEIHIHRMESLKEDNSGKLVPYVVNHTKKKSIHSDRFLPISDYELAIIQKIKEVNKHYGYKDLDYLFVDENGRTKIREIDNRIRKLCNHAHIEVKSAHDIRRTVASEMFNKGIPVEIIRNFLGHSDIQTTWGYIYDNNSKEETTNMIRKALSDFNGLKGTQVS